MADSNLLNLILAEILVCSCEILQAGCGEPGSPCGCPCRTFVSAGPPVADLVSCCNGGQLSIYARDLFPFSNFPSRGGDVNICTPSLAANVTVQLLRCWPTMKEDGSAPSAAELQAASEGIYRDQYLLTWGLICCLKVAARKRKFVLNGSRIGNPQGGCVSIDVDLTIEIFEV